jgi:hypothetical protein
LELDVAESRKEDWELVLQVAFFGRTPYFIEISFRMPTVYWMSLETIPYTVLNNLRKIMFNFLWKGNNETKHYHLCKWELLTLPKKFGGWGLRNLFDFNKALAANSLWRVLMCDGIWHKVVIDKYCHILRLKIGSDLLISIITRLPDFGEVS